MVARGKSSRRERERRARVELILDAGARLFAEHGYDGTTMAMVADEAELGKATLYYYFRTKQELFGELVAAGADRLAALTRERLQPGASAEESLAALSDVALAFFTDHSSLAGVLMPLMAAGSTTTEAQLGASGARRLGRAHAPLFAVLEPFAEHLEGGHALPDLVASLFVGLAAKLQRGGAAHARDELELFFSMVTGRSTR